ncbi:MAG: hypothetical protein IK096_00665, partial [Lachnospiraceae bacterium]|nr:hypothetical protein [Lachnospiraceae bacterium]
MLTQNNENHFGLAESNFKYWGKGGVLGTKVLGYAWDSVDQIEVTKDEKGYHFTLPAIQGKLDSSGSVSSTGSNGNVSITYSMDALTFTSDGPTPSGDGWEYVFIQEKPASFRAVLEGHLDRKSHVIGGSDDGKEYDRLIDSTITETGSFTLFYLLYYNPGGTEGDYGIYGLTEESSTYDWSVDSVFTVED